MHGRPRRRPSASRVAGRAAPRFAHLHTAGGGAGRAHAAAGLCVPRLQPGAGLDPPVLRAGRARPERMAVLAWSRPDRARPRRLAALLPERALPDDGPDAPEGPAQPAVLARPGGPAGLRLDAARSA